MSNGITAPPASSDPREIRTYLDSQFTWLNNMAGTGLQATPFTQDQLDAMVSANDLTQAGKFFFNSTDGNLYKATVNVMTNTLSITVVG